jgi:hypothetical protein
MNEEYLLVLIIIGFFNRALQLKNFSENIFDSFFYIFKFNLLTFNI